MSQAHNTPTKNDAYSSQELLEDSPSSSADFDPMDETLVSQQTEATETSQSGQASVSGCCTWPFGLSCTANIC